MIHSDVSGYNLDIFQIIMFLAAAFSYSCKRGIFLKCGRKKLHSNGGDVALTDAWKMNKIRKCKHTN